VERRLTHGAVKEKLSTCDFFPLRSKGIQGTEHHYDQNELVTGWRWWNMILSWVGAIIKD
jgi:hypothetical protein